MSTDRVQEAISPREREVLAALAGHATNAEIAEQLFISVRTVESHIASLLRKTGARDRRALAALEPSATAAVPKAPIASTLTSFVGRDAERAALAAALDEHRLVTALGPGGVGKTRLAFSVAADLADRYPDGAWIVDLVPVTDPDRIAITVAERLGVHERQGRSPIDALEAWLGPRTTLLVLDNCEHLLDPVAALLERLLADCPGLTVLATSRTRLSVPFEWVFAVPGLSTGPAGDAIALFEARAGAAGSPVAAADRPRVARICAALEGVALAIELAAARLPSLGVDGLEAALGDRLALLTGGGRADPRHRSLRATVDWSNDLLAPAERAVLRRIAVFACPFTAGAAAEVTSAVPGVPAPAVPAALAALVDGSLLDAVREADGTRYRALETIRQYGAEQLDAAGETAAIRSAHLAWCLARAESLAVEPQDDERWMRDVDALAEEARAALDRGPDLEHDREAARRLAERFARLAFVRSLPGEAQRRFEQAAALAAEPRARALALAAAAGAAEARQFGTQALRLRARAAAAFVEAGEAARAAIALARSAEAVNRFAGITDPRVEPQAAVPLLDEARELAGADPLALARVAIADVLTLDDADPEKQARALRLLEELEPLGDLVGRSSVLDAVCSSRLVSGDLRGAAAAASSRIDVLAPLGIRPELGIELTDALQMATECALGIGDLPAAIRTSERLLRLPYHAREAHLAASRPMLVTWLTGDLARCRALGARFVDGWERAGRPRVNSLAPSAGAVAAAAGVQGDLDGEAFWWGMVGRLLTRELRPEHFEVLAFRLQPLLHRGEVDEAVRLASVPPDRRTVWYGAIWRSWYAALHAEAVVLAGDPEAADRIAAARRFAVENPVAIASLDRAEALRRTDPSALGPIADRLDALGARYQAARTRIMAGGTLRRRGEAEMAACGAAPMVWPPA
ncbi:MAG TPA: LuxR C-terminal-related transcriptional regulator [Amnibacterium sp.]|nr:LuxR C-terminal-related transcriptional regulator [Amnibacterium sp.]